MIYSRRSSLPPGVAVGTTFHLGDKDALAVRDNARAHPFEDADPAAISAEAEDFANSVPSEPGEQPPVHAQPAGEERGASSSSQGADANMPQGAGSAT